MAVTLEDWAVVGNWDPYMAPECVQVRLHGKVFGHHERPDGEYILTSIIVGTEDDKIVTYSGTRYVLLMPDIEYEKSYPNAYNRLIESILKRKS